MQESKRLALLDLTVRPSRTRRAASAAVIAAAVAFARWRWASGHDYRVIRRQIRCDSLPDDPVAAGDENGLLRHGVGSRFNDGRMVTPLA